MAGDTLNSYLNLFKNQVARKLEAEYYLPSNTAAYLTLGIDKPSQYLKNLSDYLGSGETGRKRQRLIDKAVAGTKENLQNIWADLGMKELTIGYLCGVADETVNQIVLIQVKNSNQAMDKLMSPPGSDPSLKAGRQAALKKVFRVEGQREYQMYPMPYEGLPEILGGSFFSGVKGKYFSFIGNVLVLADDYQTLEGMLLKYSLNKVLANDAVYLSLAGMTSTRSSVTFFAIPYKAMPLLRELLNPSVAGEFLANEGFLLKTGAVGLQFHPDNGMLLHNLFASFAEIDYSKPQTVWESQLDAKVAIRPVIMINHLTKDKEIIVQDVASNLYLINSSGRILWKKNIGEQINSEIFQVDVMKNGRLQYLFSTGHRIHLLDRNGSYLPKYPLELKSPATNGMALIDFDHNRDYKILIACEDNLVYGFDKNGNPLKGWKFAPASGPIVQPVQYFKIQNKDYLVCADPVKVYILDRKGAAKVNPEKDFAISKNCRVIFDERASGKGPRFLLTDVTGTVYSILLDGTVESKKFGDFGPNHYFYLEDVNQDGLNEFVFVDGNKLELFRETGEKLNSRKIDGMVTSPPEFFLLSSKAKKIGITLPGKNEILLYNADATLYNGFPLYGNSLFSIGNLVKSTSYQNLLVGSNEAYLYNYAIQ